MRVCIQENNFLLLFFRSIPGRARARKRGSFLFSQTLCSFPYNFLECSRTTGNEAQKHCVVSRTNEETPKVLLCHKRGEFESASRFKLSKKKSFWEKLSKGEERRGSRGGDPLVSSSSSNYQTSRKKKCTYYLAKRDIPHYLTQLLIGDREKGQSIFFFKRQ